jgi:two-component system nitrate/nitrite response regulator NarL
MPGEAVLSGNLAFRLVRAGIHRPARPRAPADPDTAWRPREGEILALLAAGQANKQIATALAVAENTGTHHVKGVLEKLQVENRVQAATAALQRGLVPAPDPPSG